MKNEIDGGIRLMELGGADTLLEKRNCSERACSGPASTKLDHQALCVNHFLVRCYEWLDRIDPRGRGFSNETLDGPSMRAFIEECSRKALDVSLQSKNLSNLQRGRLLDILLWAAELFPLLRVPKLSFAQSMGFSESHIPARSASQYYRASADGRLPLG